MPRAAAEQRPERRQAERVLFRLPRSSAMYSVRQGCKWWQEQEQRSGREGEQNVGNRIPVWWGTVAFACRTLRRRRCGKISQEGSGAPLAQPPGGETTYAAGCGKRGKRAGHPFFHRTGE